MNISVRKSCVDFTSYRAARVKSLFNVESGANFALDAALPIDDSDWKIGMVVGPSGSGKTSIGQQVWGGGALYNAENQWPADRPIIDVIAPDGDFDAVTTALAAVGLGSVPTWLRPYGALSNGERFRADLARIIAEAPARVVVDEFTSVVDRQIARMGAMAFGKAWKRGHGQCVLLSCHYDIVDWLEPDWLYDTATGTYSGRGLWRRPRVTLDLHATDKRYWRLFEQHHYLKLPWPIAASPYIGAVEGVPVCHVVFSPRPGLRDARTTRLVVLPEWQGAGVGMRFLNALCERWLRGENRYNKPMTTLFHTSHPGLCAALRRDRKWLYVSGVLSGGNKRKSGANAGAALGNAPKTGYGGHFRAVQGFRYVGEAT